MNGKELKNFIVKEVRKQEIKLLSEEEETVPGRKRPKAPMNPAEAPTRIRNSDLPGPPVASSEEDEVPEYIPLPPDKLKLVTRATDSLMKVLLDLEGEVDEEVKTVIGDVVKKLNTISKSTPPTSSPFGGSDLELDPRLKGTRKSREEKGKPDQNWSSTDMTPEEKEEFQKTGRLPDRFGGKDDGSEDTTKSSKRPRGIEPTGFTHNPGKLEE
jgi:hypothetical protein